MKLPDCPMVVADTPSHRGMWVFVAICYVTLTLSCLVL